MENKQLEELIKEVKSVLYDPTLYYDEKMGHLINFMNLAFHHGYNSGASDMLHDLRRIIDEEFGD